MFALSKRSFSSPIGLITIIASARGLSALTFSKDQNLPLPVQKYQANHTWIQDYQHTLEQTEQWLDQYFTKKRTHLPLPPFDLQGTPFMQAAWAALLRVGFGKTLSYGKLAAKLGAPNAARAIGKAMGQNPIPILVPCHRIIGSNHTLTGYSAGLHRKIWLLKHEDFLLNLNDPKQPALRASEPLI